MATKQPQRQKPRLATGKEMAVFYARKTRIDDRPKSTRNRAAEKGNGVMKLSDFNWDLLPVHTVIHASFSYDNYHRLMWRGYGRFTNLDTGSEWFVNESQLELRSIEVPAFTIGG